MEGDFIKYLTAASKRLTETQGEFDTVNTNSDVKKEILELGKALLMMYYNFTLSKT